jgi:hypothetical protein
VRLVTKTKLVGVKVLRGTRMYVVRTCWSKVQESRGKQAQGLARIDRPFVGFKTGLGFGGATLLGAEEGGEGEVADDRGKVCGTGSGEAGAVLDDMGNHLRVCSTAGALIGLGRQGEIGQHMPR